MKARLLLVVLILLIPVSDYVAQENPDPKQAELAIWARLKAMTQADFKQLATRAQSADPEAQYCVGKMYEEGILVPKDPDLKSAEQGNTRAQRSYGFGTMDDVLAVKWHRKAAVAGDPDAQVELGQRYVDGDGVEQSYKLAAEWFGKAAEHFPDLGGAGQGRYRLAKLYVGGLGVPQDYAQAYFWLSLERPESAVDVKTHLSPAQIEETDRAVREWKSKHHVSPDVAAALHIED
jgi:TPR repeat protein